MINIAINVGIANTYVPLNAYDEASMLCVLVRWLLLSDLAIEAGSGYYSWLGICILYA